VISDAPSVLTRRVQTALSGGSVARVRVPSLAVLAVGMAFVAIAPFDGSLSHSSAARIGGLITACLIAATTWRRAIVEAPDPAWGAIAASTTFAIPLQVWAS